MTQSKDIADLRARAEVGDAEACNDLGLGYLTGEGVKQDDAEAARLIGRAAEQGLPLAKFNLGTLYHRGTGVEQDIAKARDLFQEAADAGETRALNSLGTLYLEGSGVPQDYTKARRFFQAAADQGSANGQLNLDGIDRLGLGEQPDPMRVVEQGRPVAQIRLGVKLLEGKRVPQDFAIARRLFQAAADQGSAAGNFNLGRMFVQGLGTELDPKRAAEHYRLAAEDGHAKSQHELGAMYLEGEGVPRDFAMALRFFQAAADQGLAIANFNIARIYQNGLGSAPDFKRARKHYRLAAKRGYKPAKADLWQLTKPVTSLRPLGWAIVLAALLYPFIAALTFSGPYRSLVWLQLKLFGAFIPPWTVLVLLMATLSLASILIHRLPGTRYKRSALNPDWYQRLKFFLKYKHPILYYFTAYLLIVLTLVIFPLIPPQKLWDGLTAGPLAQSEVSQIASGSVPESRYVDIAGIPRFDLGGSSGVETLRSPVLVRALFPLVEPGWTSGETIFVFVDTYATNLRDIQAAYQPENDYQASGGFNSRQRHDHDATGRAMVRLRGVLREDGLSSLMKEELLAAGLKIADPYYVLDHSLSPEDAWYLLRLIMLLLIGLPVVILLIFLFLVLAEMAQK